MNRYLFLVFLLTAAVGGVALGSGPSGGARLDPAKSPPKAPEEDPGNKVKDLTLRLDSTHTMIPPWDNMTLRLVLTNHGKQVRAFDDMPTEQNRLEYCRSLGFTVHFASGKVAEIDGPFKPTRGPGEKVWKVRPLALPGDGEAVAELLFGETILLNTEFLDAFHKSRQFSITAVVRPLGLKSNTLYINGKFKK